MTYNNSHPGLEYADGVLKGPGTPGQPVKLTGDNEFSVVTGQSDKVAGILHRCDKDCSAQGANETTPCVVDMGETVFQTDNHSGSPTAGTDLTFSAAGVLLAATTGKTIVGKVLAVEGSEISVLWTNHGKVSA